MDKNNSERKVQSKTKDNLLLLFSMDEFKRKVEEIRKELEIPKEMYDEEIDNEDRGLYSQMWTSRTVKRLDNMLENGEKNVSKLPFNILGDGIKEIINEFNLPDNYYSSIEHFIYFNKIQYPALPFSIEGNNKKSVTVKIYEKITDKDLVQIKKFVNKYFGKNLQQIRPLKNIETKIVVEKYYNNRNVYDPESFKKYKLDAKEIAENVKADTGNKIKIKDILDIPRKLKDTREKRFKKFGKK